MAKTKKDNVKKVDLRRESFMAGMKAAHEIDSEKFGRSFGSSGKVKEAAYKKFLKTKKDD